MASGVAVAWYARITDERCDSAIAACEMVRRSRSVSHAPNAGNRAPRPLPNAKVPAGICLESVGENPANRKAVAESEPSVFAQDSMLEMTDGILRTL